MASESLPSRRGQLIFILGSVVLVAVVAVVIVLATGGGSDSTVELSENGPITVTGDLLPAFEGDTATDNGAGLAAPILEGESFDGTAVVVEPGSPTLLRSWRTGAHIVRLRCLGSCRVGGKSLRPARSERCRGGNSFGG